MGSEAEVKELRSAVGRDEATELEAASAGSLRRGVLESAANAGFLRRGGLVILPLNRNAFVSLIKMSEDSRSIHSSLDGASTRYSLGVNESSTFKELHGDGPLTHASVVDENDQKLRPPSCPVWKDDF